jgi:hypothetical protein
LIKNVGSEEHLASLTYEPRPISKFIFYLADFTENDELSDCRIALCFFIFCVCPAWALVSKIPYYSRGCKSLVRGFVTRSIASRKLVCREAWSEGSETAKPGSNEQELDTEAV